MGKKGLLLEQALLPLGISHAHCNVKSLRTMNPYNLTASRRPCLLATLQWHSNLGVGFRGVPKLQHSPSFVELTSGSLFSFHIVSNWMKLKVRIWDWSRRFSG